LALPTLAGREGAAGAAAHQVEPVEGQREAGRIGSTVQRVVELSFGAVGQGEVAHPAAFAAHQVMVVMLGEVFGQLVVRVFVAGGDAADQAGLLEHRQVAVHRALGKTWAVTQDHRDGEWFAGLGQGVQQLAPSRRVALPVVAQALEGHVVDLHRARCYRGHADHRPARARPCASGVENGA
jgi:hypothetical protein